MILILVALIIIIFLLVRNLGFINHKPMIPTGNVDIFDIIFEQKCDNTSNNCDCNKDIINSTYQEDISYKEDNQNPNNPPEDEKGLYVFDNTTEYSKNTPLNIFTNTTYYVVNDKIAPSSANSYQFVIRNHNDFNIKYNLQLTEENKNNINMKYRLKLNGIYVAGSDTEWLTYEELQQKDVALAMESYDVYTLDWKWFESDNDTEVGTNINSDYKLGLTITAFGY